MLDKAFFGMGVVIQPPPKLNVIHWQQMMRLSAAIALSSGGASGATPLGRCVPVCRHGAWTRVAGNRKEVHRGNGALKERKKQWMLASVYIGN